MFCHAEMFLLSSPLPPLFETLESGPIITVWGYNTVFLICSKGSYKANDAMLFASLDNGSFEQLSSFLRIALPPEWTNKGLLRCEKKGNPTLSEVIYS